MSPSKSVLDRLQKHRSSRWGEHREAFKDATATVTLPAEAASVSLDEVMAPIECGHRRAKRDAAQATGLRATQAPSGFGRSGVGTVSFYDCKGDGQRLRTLISARCCRPRR